MKAETKPSVRVNLAAKKKLELIQERTNRSLTALLDRAIDLLEREILLQQVDADVSYLVSDEKALRRYMESTAVFEGADLDGLERE